ncbi:tail fiber assembly protein [Enterobacter hormaechei]|nr:tail fiber assembly protein [Enterobacter hormaechei]MBN6399832.1 tail fiber assembly protein [Enterobacter hormaechei]SAI18205.1 putative tail fiber protein [Enterobacter hormaechei]
MRWKQSIPPTHQILNGLQSHLNPGADKLIGRNFNGASVFLAGYFITGEYRSVCENRTLQDAVDLDMATDEEKSRYDTWRKYRVLLTRVDTSQAPDINWPDPPED